MSKKNNEISIDLIKLIKYVLRHIWVPLIPVIIGFGIMYWRIARLPNTYTAYGTMYVYNGNPNLVNYQYASTSDLDSAVQLIDTYMIVVKSNKVMDVVVERLLKDYPGIEASFIARTIYMTSVSETGVVRVGCATGDPQLSTDICNAVLDVAPTEIIRVVGAGSIEIIDYASVPTHPDVRKPLSYGIIGAMIGGMIGLVLLVIVYLLNRRITDTVEITESYTPPILASVPRRKKDSPKTEDFLLNRMSPMEMIESYARLRMNLLYILSSNDSHSVVVTSAVPGEGKSTIAANLAISCSVGGKKVLLVDADLRRASQKENFESAAHADGLSDSLAGSCRWQDAVIKNVAESMDLLPAGHFPSNPAVLLGSKEMERVLGEMEEEYDLVLLDMPPVNVVTDPLMLSPYVAGCLFVVRQDFSDHSDLKKALNAAEMTGMNVMGFVFFGEKVGEDEYYRKKYRKDYYSRYDNRTNPDMNRTAAQQSTTAEHAGTNPAAGKKKKK